MVALASGASAAQTDRLTRRLRELVEPIFGVIFQVPEARTGSLGLSPISWNMAGRAAALGPVEPELASAVFATFNPAVVERSLEGVWQRVPIETVLDQRVAISCHALEDIVGENKSRLARALELMRPIATASPAFAAPLYAGVKSLPWPTADVGALWRCCELIREHRGDAHNAAWRAAGLDPTEINVLTELWKAVPAGSIAVNQMAWPPKKAEQALNRLQAAGLAQDDAITPAGNVLRENIELATSLQQSQLAEALAPYADELFDLISPWAHRCRDAAIAYWNRDETTPNKP